MVDKWNIEIGKKYIIGRSKRKVDIIIQDSNISRVQSEFIFYDKDKIMIKDLDSSNGTFINKIKIEPRKEEYISARDIISIGDEKNELIFEVQKEEEEKKSNFDEEKKTNENNEIKFEDINYREKNQKNIRKRKISKEPFSKDSSYKRYDNKFDKYNHRDERDNRYERYNRYNDRDDKDDKYRNKSKKYSRSRSYSNSRKNSNDKEEFIYWAKDPDNNLWHKSKINNMNQSSYLDEHTQLNIKEIMETGQIIILFYNEINKVHPDRGKILDSLQQMQQISNDIDCMLKI